MKDTDTLLRVIGGCWSDSFRPDPEVIGRIARTLISSGWVHLDEDDVVQDLRADRKRMAIEIDKLRGEVASLARFVEEGRKERDEARVMASEALGDANMARAEVYRVANELCNARGVIADLEEEVATMRCDNPAPTTGDAEEFASLIESLVLARILKHKQLALFR